MAADDIHEVVGKRLRTADQRYTPRRRQIVDALAAHGRPMTLPELLGADTTLAQSSAYRNLTVLEQVGVVARIVTTSDHASFELAEDLTGHHHHLVCGGCGDVSDFALDPSVEAELERVLARAARRARYAIEQHRVDVVGRCSACQ